MTDTPNWTRRRTLRAAGLLATVGLTATGTAAANPGRPNFGPAVYGDGKTWGTKGTTELPAPTDATVQSYDRLFAFTNGAGGQLPVSEAAPGNPDYSGGRWFTHTVTWTGAGMAAHDPLPVLTRYGPADDFDAIAFHEALGHLTVEAGTFEGGPLPYFQCPLLPDKSSG